MQIVGFFPCSNGFVLICMLDCNLQFLFHRIGDTEHHVPVAVKCDRMPDHTVRQFDGDYIILVVCVKLQNQVVAFLKRRISGESGITGNIIQRTVNFVILDADSRLQVFDILAKNFRLIVFGSNGETD